MKNTRGSYDYKFALLNSAQCFYREGHAYIVKNPMVCLMGPTTKFL